jgi:acyl-coenzyme A synthetase/AMP-(fatty) acid ligase
LFTTVSVYPPNPKKLEQDLRKFQVFIENAQCDKAITTQEYKRFVQISSVTTKWPAGIKNWLATDSLIATKIKVDKTKINHRADDDEIAFIQYTSGSTGT